jgi:hypothetical protein
MYPEFRKKIKDKYVMPPPLPAGRGAAAQPAGRGAAPQPAGRGAAPR